MAALLRALLLSLRSIGGQILLLLGQNAVTVGAELGIRAAVVGAWATFLGVFWTKVVGMGLHDALMGVTMSGLSGAVMSLIDAIFPINFVLGLCFAYINFKLTVGIAARVMSRAIRFMFGG
jgi:hypothetical protein